MRKKKIENPLVDDIPRFGKTERITIYTAIALIIAGISGAVLSRIPSKEIKTPKQTLSLKICTPEEKAKVEATLQKGRQATGNEVANVLSDLDEILEKKLDCGWEPVMDLKGKLNSRRQP